MDVGVIGVGAMGKNHVRVYSELKGVDTVYVYDPIRENAERTGEFATICASPEELLGKAEAVSICVPTRYHFDIAQKAILAGVDCLIEKPITMTAKEGKLLVKLIEKSDLTVGVGHIERFNHCRGDQKDHPEAGLCLHQEAQPHLQPHNRCLLCRGPQEPRY